MSSRHGERSYRVLQALLVTRMVLGFYSPDLLPGRRARIFARLYCILASTVIPYGMIGATHIITHTFIILQLVALTIFSINQKTSVSNYFLRVRKRCLTRESMDLLLNIVLSLIYIVLFGIILQSLSSIVFCLAFPNCMENASVYVSIKLAHISIAIGESPKLVTLGLLYVDTRSMLRQLQLRRRQNFVHSFVRTYELVHSDFQKYEKSTKFLIFLGILSSCLLTLSTVAENTLFLGNINLVSLHLAMILGWVFFTGFLPLVMLELVASVVEEIVLELLHQRMLATDNRMRHALGCAVRSVRARPMRYSLLRAVPLDARLAFALASLYASFAIALLQILKLSPQLRQQIPLIGANSSR